MIRNKIQVVLIVIVVLVGGSLSLYRFFGVGAGMVNLFKDSVVKIDTVYIPVEIAQTPAARTQGLSGRAALPENGGLLFAFPKADYYAFWMKDMLFSIDIIWIDANARIINIQENVSPDTYPEKFRPYRPAQYVLEVAAGFAKNHSFREGMEVSLPSGIVAE